MKIFICTMEDPIYTRSFIETIIAARSAEIVGVAVSRRNRLSIGRRRSRAAYVLALLLIMGPAAFARNVGTVLAFKGRRWAARFTGRVASPSILAVAASYGIPTYQVDTVNDPAFLRQLRTLAPDIIINQAQDILKDEFLAIPRLGVLNRHNALLPRNRGRLTPFWVAYRNERETGVSIHLVTEQIDAGDIVVQERFEVTEADDFNSIARKNYEVAPRAMLRALDVLERGEETRMANDERRATYNTVPRVRDAARYRIGRIRRALA